MTDNRTVTFLVTLALLGMVAWWEMPPWQRALIIRAARLRTRRLASRLARASGRRAMGRELAGAPESEAGYDRTFRLSTLRDRL